MNKLRELIEWLYNNVVNTLRLDDLLHSYVSTILFVVFFCIMECFMGFFGSLLCGTAITFALGLFKEYVIDKWLRKTFVDKRDLISDAIGIAIGVAIVCLVAIFV